MHVVQYARLAHRWGQSPNKIDNLKLISDIVFVLERLV